MDRLHAVILAHVRARLVATPMQATVADWTDDQLVRRMFCNYRDGRGMRLTALGHQLLQYCFEHHSFPYNGEPISPTELMFLDARVKLPFFRSERELALYDTMFAVRLRLVDGNIRTLMEIDAPD